MNSNWCVIVDLRLVDNFRGPWSGTSASEDYGSRRGSQARGARGPDSGQDAIHSHCSHWYERKRDEKEREGKLNQ